MKLNTPENVNYAASVVKIKNIIPLENCDNIVATSIYGFQAVVDKSHVADEMGIVFPAETQLSVEYTKENNLFRHTDFNKDPKEKGYLEDNRRVRAVKFRGHRSDCLFMPIDSLKWTKAKLSELKEGDTFDELNGKKICNKYVLKLPESRQDKKIRLSKKYNRIEPKYIPEHFDTDNYFRVSDKLPDNASFIVTQKVHGTSIRIAHTIVKRRLNIIEMVLKKMRVGIKEWEFDYVYGSRKVIKDANNPLHTHFYDVDIWSTEGKKLTGILPQNYIMYGELIGFTPTGTALQADYTYDVPLTQCRLYIYRIAFINNDGLIVDLAWDQVLEFCKRNGLTTVPEIWRGQKKDFKPEELIDKRLFDGGLTQCVPLSHPTLPDEGVVVRIDGLQPYFMKAKSPLFLQHETKLIDKGTLDIETEESVV